MFFAIKAVVQCDCAHPGNHSDYETVDAQLRTSRRTASTHNILHNRQSNEVFKYNNHKDRLKTYEPNKP